MNKIITILFFIGLLGCKSSDKSKLLSIETERIKKDSIDRVKTDSIENEKSRQDSIYKLSPEYKTLQKEKKTLIAKYEKFILNNFEMVKVSRRGTTDKAFNMNKYIEFCEGQGLLKGEYTGWFKGTVNNLKVSIEMRQATPSGSGWVQHFYICVDDESKTLDIN